MNKFRRNHIVSQFLYRNFTSTSTKRQNQQKVYTLDLIGSICQRKIRSICHKLDYNTCQQEKDFAMLEKIAAESIRNIINSNHNYSDLQNVHGYVGYLIANQPYTRQIFIDKMLETTNSVEVKQGIYGKGALTLMFAKLIMDELMSWESYIYRIDPIKTNEYEDLFITSDNPVDTNRKDAIQVGQTVMYGDVENSRIEDGKRVTKYYWEIPDVSIKEDTYYFLPLNPVTAVYIYKTPSQRNDLIQEKQVIQKMNLNQLRGSTDFAISP